ncbi:MAG: rhodanese-like domain-containing protein [Flavobacteriaceae bacterium]
MSLFSSLFAPKTQDQNKFELLDVSAFKKAVINKNVQLVDVRTEKEYRGGHLGKAINIDFFQPKRFMEAFKKLDRKKPVYIYCRSGNRSKRAARRLFKMGFIKVFDLKGGILNWE